MGIFLTIFFQKFDIFGSVNNFKILLAFDDFVKKAFHTSAVNDEGVGIFQGFHILGHELVVVQASRLWLCHIGDCNAVDALCDIECSDIHRVEGCDNAECAVLSVGFTACRVCSSTAC